MYMSETLFVCCIVYCSSRLQFLNHLLLLDPLLITVTLYELFSRTIGHLNICYISLLGRSRGHANGPYGRQSQANVPDRHEVPCRRASAWTSR
jgi:hypothetical protein